MLGKLTGEQLKTKEGLKDLNHRLPNERYEDYLCAIIHHIQDESLSTLKKTVRIQKIMRLLYDEQIIGKEDENESNN